MEGYGKRHALVTLTPNPSGKTHGTNSVRVWVGPSTGFDVLERRQTSNPGFELRIVY
jgi:hypothetical protein